MTELKNFRKLQWVIILNLKHFPDTLRCNLIVTKRLPILLYGLHWAELSQRKVYLLNLALKNVCRLIFNLSKYAHVSDLLKVFDIFHISYYIDKSFLLCLNKLKCFNSSVLSNVCARWRCSVNFFNLLPMYNSSSQLSPASVRFVVKSFYV